MLDRETRNMLKALSDIINDNIDRLILERDMSNKQLTKDYRYVTRKLEHALGQVHLAGERANSDEQ